jgi:hypothetical protein
MIDANDKLLFLQSPSVVIATNTFKAPVVIQYNDTPMLEVVTEITTLNLRGYTTKIPIFHSDGTKLAVAVGSRLVATADGEKAGVTMRHPPDLTVCELNGKPIFELRRKGAAAVSTTAELYTNDGSFLKWSEESVSGLLFNDPSKPFPIHSDANGLVIEGISFCGNTFEGDIGILLGRTTKAAGIALAFDLAAK